MEMTSTDNLVEYKYL